MTTLFKYFRKIEKKIMQPNIPPFILTQKEKRLLMRVKLMISLDKSLLQLYQSYKNILENV